MCTLVLFTPVLNLMMFEIYCRSLIQPSRSSLLFNYDKYRPDVLFWFAMTCSTSTCKKIKWKKNTNKRVKYGIKR